MFNPFGRVMFKRLTVLLTQIQSDWLQKLREAKIEDKKKKNLNSLCVIFLFLHLILVQAYLPFKHNTHCMIFSHTRAGFHVLTPHTRGRCHLSNNHCRIWCFSQFIISLMKQMERRQPVAVPFFGDYYIFNFVKIPLDELQ